MNAATNTKTLFRAQHYFHAVYLVAHFCKLTIRCSRRSYFPMCTRTSDSDTTSSITSSSRSHPQRTRSRIFKNDFLHCFGLPVTEPSEDKYFILHSYISFSFPKCRLSSSSDVNSEYILTPSTLGEIVNSSRKHDY